MKNILKELRIHHYTKNLLVFVALACSGCFFDIYKLIPGIWSFLAFCMISSSVYIFNDIHDVEKDRNHPTKCQSPFASGAISLKKGWTMFFVLICLAVAFNCMAYSLLSSVLLLLYFTLNIAYSLGLKDIPILDVTILVSGFLIRVLYGAVMTQIEVSNWLYLTVIASAFYFALGKRRNELKRVETGVTRKVLSFYTEGFLDKNMYMCLGLANTFYALWAMDKGSAGGYSKYLIWTVPIVFLIFMKYSLNIEGNSDGDPVEVLVHDKILIALCVIYGLAMCGIIYL